MQAGSKQRPTLVRGCSGPNVKDLQGALNLGDSAQTKLAIDAAFGTKTRNRVIEFQSQKNLTPDGIVGPMTWKALAGLLNILADLTKDTGQTPKEDQFRDRIVSEANKALTIWGWSRTDVQADRSPRIAAAIMVPPKALRGPRQGGASLSEIFDTAGADGGNTRHCRIITNTIVLAYQKPESLERTDQLNNQDIGSWCGIFAFYIYRMAGLSIMPWAEYQKETRKFLLTEQDKKKTPGLLAKDKKLEVVRYDGDVQRGDIGYLFRTHNHHFIVTEDVTSDSFESIDGNLGRVLESQKIPPVHSVIAERTHSRSEVKKSGGCFL
jgi:Putative peptidoglycan binding domain